MSVLALKALDYGADRIPDKVWHSVPGGFFRPPEAKNKKDKKGKSRNKSEQRDSSHRRSRHSTRNRSPSGEHSYSDYSAYDTEDEREQRYRNRRRAKSLGRSPSTSLNRDSRDHHLQMERADHSERGEPQFPPPPTSEYRPYDPRDYAGPSAQTGASMPNGHYDQYDHRASSARPDYGYPPQVNTAFRSRSATVPSEGPSSLRLPLLPQSMARRLPPNLSTPPLVNFPSSFSSNTLHNSAPSVTPTFRSRSATAPSECPPSLRPTLFRSAMAKKPPSGLAMPSPFEAPSPILLNALRSGTPLNASFSPSYEPPLAALFGRSNSNPRQPSSTASRYTPVAGYTPSPEPVNAPLPPPNPGYAPYIPAAHAPAAPASPAYRAPGNKYPSPPPFYRQESHSQPSVDQYSYTDNQLAAYDPPDRRASISSSRPRRNGDEKRHRARSADHRRSSRSRVTDKVRERLESLDVHDKGLAASMGGALAGGLVGRNLGHGTLSTLIGAGIGALGGMEIEKRHEKDKAIRSTSRPRERSSSDRRDTTRDYIRSPSRDRRRGRHYEDGYSSSSSESDRGARRRRGGSRKSYSKDY